MPRGGGGRSSGGRSSFRSSSSSGSRKSSSQPEFKARTAPPKAPAPAPTAAAAPPAPKTDSSSGGMALADAVSDGFGWGVGNAMGHRFMEAIFGPRTVKHEVVSQPAPAPVSSSVDGVCGNQSNTFLECLNSNTGDISKCQFYMDMLSECRRSSGSSGLSA